MSSNTAAALEPIPRASLLWLLFALWVSLLPLLSELPWWLLIIGVSVTFWRWKIFLGAWNYPRRSLKVTLTLFVTIGLLFTFRSQSVGMQAMLSLLVAGFILKLLELHYQKNIFLLCFLAYFVASTQFLLGSSFLISLYGFFNVAVITCALIAANQSQQQNSIRYTSITLFKLFGQALPLMLLLFLVVPRFGSLWTVPLNNAQAKTGVSNSMAPGDFTNLIRSGDPAFRVTFEGEIPASSQLYWRGLVLSDFDGRSWSQNASESVQIKRRQGFRDFRRMAFDPRKEQVDWQGDATKYQIILEPSQNNWLYALPAVRTVSNNLKVNSNLTLYQFSPVTQRYQYSVSSHLNYIFQGDELSSETRNITTSIPEDFNSITRQNARLWRKEAELQIGENGDVSQILMTRILQHFNQSFRYTLKPPLLGRNSIDEFLWGEQAGFCEHFASSFVFFMRAAGIPARVVVGYLGGEVNPLENYLMVRQYDAHAWAEVWLPKQGWIRVDPTAAVAPERIEQGAEFSLSEDEYWLMGNAFSRRLAWLGTMQLHWDAFNFRWQRWVMDYDTNAQQEFLSRWFGNKEPWRIALIVISIMGCFIALLIGMMIWRQRPTKALPQQRYYRLFCNKLAKCGVNRNDGEAPRDFSARACEILPSVSDAVQKITHLFERAEYGGDNASLLELKLAVARFSPKKLKA